MSEPGLATKAPESDAAEASPFPGDPKAQEGASMGEHCTTDRPAPDGTPSGELSKFGDIEVYVSKPVDYPHSPSKLLLLLTGGTGIKSTNNQLQADKYASEGYVVVMPDQFAGDPAPNSVTDTNAAEESNPSIIEKIKVGAAETAKSFLIDMWLARHTSEKVLPILHRVLDTAKDEYADAVANGGGIYAAGYCFGAKYVLMLAGGQPPTIKVGAIAHATLVTRDDLKAIEAPISMVCVENDPVFPDEILQEGREHLDLANIEHEIKVYSGVPHGFAVLGDYQDAKIAAAQQKAFTQMSTWLKAH